MISIFIHFPANDIISCFSAAESYSMVCAHVCVYVFFYSSVPGHLRWCHTLAIVKRPAINMVILESFLYIELSSFGFMPKSGMVRSQGRFIFSFLR
jgi:hypothetical protein